MAGIHRSRVGALLFSFILAATSVGAIAAPASADANFTWSSSWGGWIDNRCGTDDEIMRIAINSESDGTGAKAKLCSQWVLSYVPRTSAGLPNSFDNVVSAIYFYSQTWTAYGLLAYVVHYPPGDYGGVFVDQFFGDGWVPVNTVFPNGDNVHHILLDNRISLIACCYAT